MARKHTTSTVYRMTTTLAVGGLILALAMQPARADSPTDELAQGIGTVLVEQGQSAMQNIAHDIVTGTDWQTQMGKQLADIAVESEPAATAADERDEPQVAGR